MMTIPLEQDDPDFKRAFDLVNLHAVKLPYKTSMELFKTSVIEKVRCLKNAFQRKDIVEGKTEIWNKFVKKRGPLFRVYYYGSLAVVYLNLQIYFVWSSQITHFIRPCQLTVYLTLSNYLHNSVWPCQIQSVFSGFCVYLRDREMILAARFELWLRFDSFIFRTLHFMCRKKKLFSFFSECLTQFWKMGQRHVTEYIDYWYFISLYRRTRTQLLSFSQFPLKIHLGEGYT